MNLEDAIELITGGDLSDLSDLSEESDFEELPGTHFTDDEDDSHGLEDAEDDVLISSIQHKKRRNEDLGGDEIDDNQNIDATRSNKYKFRRQKKDTLVKSLNKITQFCSTVYRTTSSRNDFILIFPNFFS